MPRGDKTGPVGAGPMTGKSMGFCTGYNTPGCMNHCFGKEVGQGFERGFGRGFGQGSEKEFGQCSTRGFGKGLGGGFGQGFGKRFWTTPQEMVQSTKEVQENKEPNKKELLKELKAEKAEIDKAIKKLEQKKK